MQANRNIQRAVKAAIESLENRQMLAGNPTPELIGIQDSSNTFFNTRKAIAFYDVSNIRTGTNLFAQSPLFSIWQGFEVTDAAGSANDENPEEGQAFAVSPDGRIGYELAFDSGSPNVLGSSGDYSGDYDIYRMDIRAAYDDFLANNRPRGIMYAPRFSSDYLPTSATNSGIDANVAFASKPIGPTGLPGVTAADVGVPVGRDNTNAIGSDDIIFLDGIVAKVGEVARAGAQLASTPFFDDQDIQVVSDDKIVLMETATTDPLGTGPLSSDYSIRTLERVSTTPGLATYNPANDTGGFNATSTQSWQSFQWTGDNYVDMDNNAGTGGISDVDGMRYVDKNGVKGVWVTDRDGGGDQFSFFNMNFATRVATKLEQKAGTAPYGKAFDLDEDPEADPNSNDGDLSGFDVDSNGRLVIRESDFLGTGNVDNKESKVITRDITTYAGGDTDTNGTNEVQPGAWHTLGRLNPTVTDDAGPINSEYGVYDNAQNVIYYFPKDSLNQDVYVYDLATKTIIYQELDGTDHQFFSGNKIRAFTLTQSDTTPPTLVLSYANQTEQAITLQFSENVAASFAAGDLVLTNTTTGTVIPTADLTLTSLGNNAYKLIYKTGATTAPLPKGKYTLAVTGSGVTDAAGNALAGTPSITFNVLPGDANGDNAVNFADLVILAQRYNTTGNTLSSANFSYDAAGLVDFADLVILAQNYNGSLPAITFANGMMILPSAGPAPRAVTPLVTIDPVKSTVKGRVATQVL